MGTLYVSTQKIEEHNFFFAVIIINSQTKVPSNPLLPSITNIKSALREGN